MDKNDNQYISGFSSLSKAEKIEWLSGVSNTDAQFLTNQVWHEGKEATIFDGLSENTIAHFVSPFGVAPNFKVNNVDYILPLVTEESSVVAALSKAAKIWYSRGGFCARVLGTQKKGQVHFFWQGGMERLEIFFSEFESQARKEIYPLTKKMEHRGGGVSTISLVDKTAKLDDYFQLDVDFETGDAMGANFINSVLEKMAVILRDFYAAKYPEIPSPEVNMAILSNYTPGCLVEAWGECPVEKLDGIVKGMPVDQFTSRFEKAVRISQVDVSRAVTHNKGIFNGIDSLALATGNDWRALEADGHAFASRNGQYRGLTDVEIDKGIFRFSIRVPINIGTVGGVTNIHPLAKAAMQILNNPSVKELMQLFAVAGMASNFAALTSLIGTGIQAGHMKLHLQNILIQLNASSSQKEKATRYFSGKTVSYSAVRDFLNETV